MQPAEMTDEQCNAAVAAEVMGWAEWVDFQSDYDGPFPAFHNNCGRIDVYPDAGDGDVYDWSPVTDYAAAFDVVERMREDGWVFMLHQWNDSKTVRATFHRLGSGKPYRTGDAPVGQDARAICEAALKAVRSET